MPDIPSFLERCARPHLAENLRYPAYRTLGSIGAVVGFVVVVLLAALADRPWNEVAVVTITVPASFLLAVKLSVIAFRYERIVFYEKTLFVLGMTAVVLHSAGLPLGRGIDLATIGTGVFLVFGRLGCFMVACCYGCPARWGVRYGEAHARVGFPPWLVGRTLFPLQLVDAAVSTLGVAAALVAWRTTAAPGVAAAIYLVVYGLGRFFEEFFRHDAARPRWCGGSEAQWTAVLIAWGLLMLIGIRWWTAANATLLTIALVATFTRRRRLTDAWHTAELAAKFRELESQATSSAVTSLGIHASFARIDTPVGRFRDFILSSPDAATLLDEGTVASLVDAVGLDGATIRPAATPGLFHVLVRL